MLQKSILFSTEMVKAILEGRKTQTRRVIKPQPELKPGICPYGEPGDLLWVRETWACIGAEHVKPSEIAPGYTVQYKADNDREHWRVEKWRPSIFMPRWASRITLRIVNVRVERLQQISEADAQAEGVVNCIVNDAGLWDQPKPRLTHIYNFQKLWDSINAKRGYSWGSNPWVWVVCFEKVEVHNA